MANTVQTTFPGVYTAIRDQSFLPPSPARYRAGLVGVASKGPFDLATRIRSLKEFRQTFGEPVDSQTVGFITTDFFLADAVGMISDFTDGIYIVRVGHEYEPVGGAGCSGWAGTGSDTVQGRYHITPGTTDPYHTIYTSAGAALAVKSVYDVHSELWIKVTEAGKRSSVNLAVSNSKTSGWDGAVGKAYINTQAGADNEFLDDYVSGDLEYSNLTDAANHAQTTLYGYQWGNGTTAGLPVFTSLTNNVYGTKGQFKLWLQYNTTTGTQYPNASFALQIGDVLKIAQTSQNITYEARIKRITGGIITEGDETAPVGVTDGYTIYFEPSNIAQIGYQAVPLADNYDAGDGTLAGRANLYKVKTPTGGEEPTKVVYVTAATDGEWANGSDKTIGLYVKVLPGSKAGTKKFEVYENAALAEVWDNLLFYATDNPALDIATDFVETKINDVSQYITVAVVTSTGLVPANTSDPWDTTMVPQRVDDVTVRSMPCKAVTGTTGDSPGQINHGGTFGKHGSFLDGWNGQIVDASDIVGGYDPITDTLTGIKQFEDMDTVNVDTLSAPGYTHNEDVGQAVRQELIRVAAKINAMALIDIPDNLNLYQATDWHNGYGQFSAEGRIDSRNAAFYWNWFEVSDRFSSDPTSTKWLPPSIGAMRCLAYTFRNEKPWFAAAGENRGLLPEALDVRYRKVSAEAKNSSYGDTNSVNGIYLNRNRIMLFGERTMQRAESKLTAVHSMILVNYIVKGLSELARTFVFDPNDPELLQQLTLAFTEFLDKIKNERGMEGYSLVIDETNNTPDSRNRREVIVDLYLIPTDSVERIYINATVRESGANLEEVNA